MDIKLLDINNRAVNALKAAGVHTVDQLRALSFEQLEMFTGIGEKGVLQIVWSMTQELIRYEKEQRKALEAMFEENPLVLQ